MTTTVRGWLMRDKGLFYLGTAAGWWRLANLSSGMLGELGLAPESPVVVRGERLEGFVLRVEQISERRGARRRPDRPALVADPAPQLFVASDLRLRAHTWLRQDGFLEVSLPVGDEHRAEPVDLPAGGRAGARLAGNGAVASARSAVADGLNRFFAFARRTTAQANRTEDLAERELLLVVDDTDEMGAGMDTVTGLVVELAAVAGVGVAAGWVVTAPFGNRDIQRLDLPGSWEQAVREVVWRRLVDAGAKVYEMRRADGGAAWLVDAGGDPVTVRRLLDRADATALNGAGSGWQVAPTWFRDPELPHVAVLTLGQREVATLFTSEDEPGFLAVLAWEDLLTVLCQLPWPGAAQLLARHASLEEVSDAC